MRRAHAYSDDEQTIQCVALLGLGGAIDVCIISDIMGLNKHESNRGVYINNNSFYNITWRLSKHVSLLSRLTKSNAPRLNAPACNVAARMRIVVYCSVCIF